MHVTPPYLLFIGDVADQLAAKTSNGIARWKPEWCLGQLRYPGCEIDLGLPDLSLEAAFSAGAKTLVLGVANRGGVMSPHWISTIKEAIKLGYDIANGLHDRLDSHPELVELAKQHGRQLLDVRYASLKCPVGSGKRRSGLRLLTVGTDCSVGKMFTTLALEKEMKARGINADFIATGQTGIFISGKGASIDAIISDFISGAVEALAPANDDPAHWDLIEGQGSLFHPSYAGVSLGLLHGAQADCLIMCHDPNRAHMRGVPEYPLVSLTECIRRNEEAGKLTNPRCRVVGISVNTSHLDEVSARSLLSELATAHQMPATDAYRFGAAPLVDAALSAVS